MTFRTREVRYTDPDEAAAAIRVSDVKFNVYAPSTSDWRVGHAELDGALLSWGRLGAASASLGSMPRDATLILMAGAEARGWTCNRDAFTDHNVCFLSQGSSYAGSYPVPAFWYGLQSPAGWLERQCGILTRGETVFGRTVGMIEASAPRIRNAFMTAARFAIENAAHLEESVTRASLQRALVGEVVDAIAQEQSVHPRRDEKLLARLLEYLHAHPRLPIFQEDLCRVLSTSTRSLRRLFPDAFGTTPARYLRFRRFHLARRALLDRRFPSVTAAAVHFGFFDLGRFAASYRKLFGEFPSDTLSGMRLTAE